MARFSASSSSRIHDGAAPRAPLDRVYPAEIAELLERESAVSWSRLEAAIIAGEMRVTRWRLQIDRLAAEGHEVGAAHEQFLDQLESPLRTLHRYRRSLQRLEHPPISWQSTF